MTGAHLLPAQLRVGAAVGALSPPLLPLARQAAVQALTAATLPPRVLAERAASTGALARGSPARTWPIRPDANGQTGQPPTRQRATVAFEPVLTHAALALSQSTRLERVQLVKRSRPLRHVAPSCGPPGLAKPPRAEPAATLPTLVLALAAPAP